LLKALNFIINAFSLSNTFLKGNKKIEPFFGEIKDKD
jgi:hypothetical protein